MLEYIKNMRKYIGHERLLIVGASVFVHKDGRLLLQKRKDNGCWADHGGCIELGETVEETAKRELYEETGLTVCSLELIGVFSGKELFYTYPNGDMVRNESVAYLCEDYSGELIKQTDETADLQWFMIDELPENISPPDKPAFLRCVGVLRARRGSDPLGAFSIEAAETHRRFIDRQIRESWSGPFVVSKNTLHDTRTHKGFAAVSDGEVIGYILYNLADGDCEITVLESMRERQGVGRALINKVIQVAKEANCRRLWLITTNDNTRAIRFYQIYGFSLLSVHIGAMEKARKLKPNIPLTGNDGLPIDHEFEFELTLE